MNKIVTFNNIFLLHIINIITTIIMAPVFSILFPVYNTRDLLSPSVIL